MTMLLPQWPLAFEDEYEDYEFELSEEAVQDIWACDWENEQCPVCGRSMDTHTSAQYTRCAQASI